MEIMLLVKLPQAHDKPVMNNRLIPYNWILTSLMCAFGDVVLQKQWFNKCKRLILIACVHFLYYY